MNEPDEIIARKISLAEDGMVSVKEAVSMLGVSKSLLYNLMERGDLVYVRIGRRRVIPRKAIREYVTRNMAMR